MDNTLLFEAYITGNMTAHEEAEFQQRIQTDIEFHNDFKIFLFTMKGICQEAEQDNLEFGMAMARLSETEVKEAVDIPLRYRKRIGMAIRERLAWVSGIAALFIITFTAIFIVRNNYNNSIDNIVFDYYYSPTPTRGGETISNIAKMPDNELNAYLQTLIDNYQASDHAEEYELQDTQEIGMTLALAYIKLPRRNDAIVLLKELIDRFADDEEFVSTCQNILKSIE